jgi:DNA-binding IclR family transcriptional regulator
MSDNRIEFNVVGFMGTEISLSASKAMTIFTLMCDHGGPCSIAELVRLTGYSRTVVNRMIATLVHHCFIERKEDTGHYVVDPRALHLVSKALSRDPLLNRVDLIMRRIANRTGDNVLFMIRQNSHGLVIRRAEGVSHVQVYGSQVGMNLPLHCGGAPIVLLAYSEPAFVEDYLSQPLDKRTPKTCTDPGKIREVLEQIRAQGFAISDEDLFEYVVAVGAPVFEDHGRLVGAISVGNISQRYTPERIEEVRNILIEEIGRD